YCAHLLLHSFPTRRSSDLSCVFCRLFCLLCIFFSYLWCFLCLFCLSRFILWCFNTVATIGPCVVSAVGFEIIVNAVDCEVIAVQIGRASRRERRSVRVCGG